MDIEKAKSVLQLHKIYVRNISFSRDVNVTRTELVYQVKRNLDRITDNQYNISLDINVNNADNTLTLSVSVIGLFEISEAIGDDMKKKLFERNAVAILFPYLRSEVTLITAQPDLKPIVLPSININQMLDDIEEAELEKI